MGRQPRFEFFAFASTTIIGLPTDWAVRRCYAKAIGLRPIGAFTQIGSLCDPPAVSIPTASTRLRSQPLVGNEACHGVAKGEAGHTLIRQYRVENYARASQITSADVTHTTPNLSPLAESRWLGVQ